MSLEALLRLGTVRLALLGFALGVLVIPAARVLLWLVELELRADVWLNDRLLAELVIDRVVLS
jgi:hypothetical protein